MIQCPGLGFSSPLMILQRSGPVVLQGSSLWPSPVTVSTALEHPTNTGLEGFLRLFTGG